MMHAPVKYCPIEMVPVVLRGERDGASRGGVWGSLPTTATSRISCLSRSRGDPTSSGFERCASPEIKRRTRLQYLPVPGMDNDTLFFINFWIKKLVVFQYRKYFLAIKNILGQNLKISHGR
jgi:hypothetical protein